MTLNVMKHRAGHALLTFSAFASLSLTACGPSFEAASNLTGGGNGASGGGGISDPNSEFQQMKVDGTVSGGSYGENEVIGIDKTTKELIVRFPVLATPIMAGDLDVMVPDIPGAHFVMEPTPDGGQTLALRIPLDKVLKGIEFLPPSKLPNGDPLPGVPDGELPSAAVQLTRTSTKATIYLSPSYVGVYVNSSFDPYIALTLPIRNEARTKTWGYFSTIPEKKGIASGGFFISIKLPDDIARIIDDIL
ncbi:MAG: hypothetical protein V4760_00480 [Bdellovibrionota bacterium]